MRATQQQPTYPDPATIELDRTIPPPPSPPGKPTKALSAMVRAECANAGDGGTCILGGICMVVHGKRCQVPKDVHQPLSTTNHEDYFAASVLPLAKDRPEYARAAHDYAAILGKPVKTATVRKCGCGAALPKRRRKCPVCAKVARRAAQRKYASVRQIVN